MIIQGSPEILQGPRGLNNQFGAFSATDDTVVKLYQEILQRTPSASEIAYWSAGWGPTVEASEVRDFQDAAAPERIAADAWRAEQAAIAAAAAQQAAAAAQQAAIDAANRKAIADAYAAAQAAAEADRREVTSRTQINRAKAIAAVQALYLQVLGREGDQAGIDYFADKFGSVIEPDELQIFSNMAQPEIDARNQYLAEMAAKSADDAAKAKAIADEFKRVAAQAKEVVTTMPVELPDTGEYCPPGYAFDGETCRPTGLAPPPTTSGGINPALILAAAAAAFFIGG
jgi:hypothetical protein